MTSKRWLMAAATTLVLAVGGVGVGAVAAAGSTDPGFTVDDHETNVTLIPASR